MRVVGHQVGMSGEKRGRCPRTPRSCGELYSGGCAPTPLLTLTLRGEREREREREFAAVCMCITSQGAVFAAPCITLVIINKNGPHKLYNTTIIMEVHKCGP